MTRLRRAAAEEGAARNQREMKKPQAGAAQAKRAARTNPRVAQRATLQSRRSKPGVRSAQRRGSACVATEGGANASATPRQERVEFSV